MDASTLLAIVVPPVTSLGGVVVGWRLSHKSARQAAREEREWAEHQTVRQRQVAAAAALDARIVELKVPRARVSPIEMAQMIDEARVGLLKAWTRSSILDDPEILRRLNSTGVAMFIASQHARMLPVRQWAEEKDLTLPNLNPFPILVALGELREALAKFQIHEEPPPAKFPTADEVIELADPKGGLDAVHDLLLERGAT